MGPECGSLPVWEPVYWELSLRVFNLLWWAQYLSHLLSSLRLSPPSSAVFLPPRFAQASSLALRPVGEEEGGGGLGGGGQGPCFLGAHSLLLGCRDPGCQSLLGIQRASPREGSRESVAPPLLLVHGLTLGRTPGPSASVSPLVEWYCDTSYLIEGLL